jgi:hypothetical protein
MPASPLDPQGDISAVIVAYRTPDVLAECLGSIERWRPRRLAEVVVVDNSAGDEWPSPEATHPWIRYVRNSENVHFRRGVNQGARLAAARYLLLLNPDTYLTDGESLARLAELLDEHPEIGLVGPKIQGDDGRLAPQGERLPGLAYLVAQKTHLNRLWPGNPIARRRSRPADPRDRSGVVETLTAAVLLLRRDEFLAVGGLDERVAAYWEEQELARKLRRIGRSAYYRADAFVFHRWRKGGGALEPPELMRRRFDDAMRLYYRQSYGRLGGLLYGLLDAPSAVRRARRRTAQVS